MTTTGTTTVIRARDAGTSVWSPGQGDLPPELLPTVLRGALIGLGIFALVVAAGAVALPRLIGAVPVTVLDESMHPRFESGDLLIVKAVAAEELKVGDIITVWPDHDHSRLLSHRIVRIDVEDGQITSLTTQGDASSTPDAAIGVDQVVGRYLFRMPALGFLAGIAPS